jgi:hypothetical protein
MNPCSNSECALRDCFLELHQPQESDNAEQPYCTIAPSSHPRTLDHVSLEEFASRGIVTLLDASPGKKGFWCDLCMLRR